MESSYEVVADVRTLSTANWLHTLQKVHGANRYTRRRMQMRRLNQRKPSIRNDVMIDGEKCNSSSPRHALRLLL